MIKIKRIFQLLVILMATILLSGCIKTEITEGLTGKVYLGDSSLPMMGVRVVAGSSIATTDGNGYFNLTGLKMGEYEVSAQSHIGIVKGTATVNSEGKGSLNLRVPYPSGWENSEFSEIAKLSDECKCVLRWANPGELTYAFETGCSEELKINYKQVFDNVQNELGGFFRFREISNTSSANILIEKERALGLGTIGLTTTKYKNGVILSTKIAISPSFANEIGVLKHELGHALGLGHSPNQKQIMSDQCLYLSNFTQEEYLYLKGIYNLKPGLKFSSLSEIISQTPNSGTISIQ